MIAARIALLALSFAAQDTTENQEYAYWKDCKPGSTTTYAMTLLQQGQEIKGEMTRTLIEVAEDKYVVERKGQMTFQGQTMPMAPERDDVKKVEDKPTKILKDSEAEIEVAGKKMKCRYMETEKQEEQGLVRAKVWAHADVPGGLVRAEIEMGELMTMKLEARTWEKKKE